MWAVGPVTLAAPDQVAPEEVAPDQVAPDEAAPDQVAPDEAAPDQVAPDEVAADEVAPQAPAPQPGKSWPEKQFCREAAVAIVKCSSEYVLLRHLQAQWHLRPGHPRTPDPTDQDIPKRRWEATMQQWCRDIRSFLSFLQDHDQEHDQDLMDLRRP